MEGSSYRFLDMGTAEGRAEAESYKRSKAEKVRSGQSTKQGAGRRGLLLR